MFLGCHSQFWGFEFQKLRAVILWTVFKQRHICIKNWSRDVALSALTLLLLKNNFHA